MGCSHIKNMEFSSPANSTSALLYTSSYQKSTAYDFPDIPIPPDLKLDHKRSIVFESPNLKVGVLVYKGRVDALSLFEYFEKKLPEYGWNLRSYFKYGKYIILFSKNDKDLVIRIVDKNFITELFIWVVPRTGQGATPENQAIQEEEIKP